MFSRLVSRVTSASRAAGRSRSFQPRRAFAMASGVGVAMTCAQMTQTSACDNKVDYDAVRKDIADILDNDTHDDGSLGPILVRLAWHASGTYSKEDGTGGSNRASMRFNPEAGHGANAGLHKARDFLEPIKAKHPGISYADLWILAGVTAIEEMGGPKIGFTPGRTDCADTTGCTPDGRLPDADKGAQHLRDIFYRQGFNDQEIVALSGAHALGRCHTDRSGFKGPWTFAPTTFSNEYFRVLFEDEWQEKQLDEGKPWGGPKQFEDKKTGELMMLPTDIALTEDVEFRKHAQQYKDDEALFFKDFASAFQKLTENGCDFTKEKADPVISKSYLRILVGGIAAMTLGYGYTNN